MFHFSFFKKRILKKIPKDKEDGDFSIIIRIISKKSHFSEQLQKLTILTLTLWQHLEHALQNIIRKMVPGRFLYKIHKQGKEEGSLQAHRQVGMQTMGSGQDK